MPRALIFGPQRRSMVSSSPITTGAPAGTKALISSISSWPAAARDDHAARLVLQIAAGLILFPTALQAVIQQYSVAHPPERTERPSLALAFSPLLSP